MTYLVWLVVDKNILIHCFWQFEHFVLRMYENICTYRGCRERKTQQALHINILSVRILMSAFIAFCYQMSQKLKQSESLNMWGSGLSSDHAIFCALDISKTGQSKTLLIKYSMLKIKFLKESKWIAMNNSSAT